MNRGRDLINWEIYNCSILLLLRVVEIVVPCIPEGGVSDLSGIHTVVFFLLIFDYFHV